MLQWVEKQTQNIHIGGFSCFGAPNLYPFYSKFHEEVKINHRASAVHLLFLIFWIHLCPTIFALTVKVTDLLAKNEKMMFIATGQTTVAASRAPPACLVPLPLLLAPLLSLSSSPPCSRNNATALSYYVKYPEHMYVY